MHIHAMHVIDIEVTHVHSFMHTHVCVQLICETSCDQLHQLNSKNTVEEFGLTETHYAYNGNNVSAGGGKYGTRAGQKCHKCPQSCMNTQLLLWC